jgi:monovalent cation:H+ antiporter, CPA1 family
MHLFDLIALIIFMSGVFIFINLHFLKLPSSVGLTILAVTLTGIILALGTAFPKLHLAQHIKEYDMTEVLHRFVLSVLLFAGALNIDLHKLQKHRTPILILAITGVLISTMVVGTGVYYMLDFLGTHLNYWYCLMFGALISSTDPLAVSKAMQKYGQKESLNGKVLGESLFNDGFAVILSLVLLDLAIVQDTGNMTMNEGLIIVGRDLLGGTIIGVFFGLLGYQLLKYVDNDSVEVEVLITLSMVMSAAFMADYFVVSEPTAVVIMGIMAGNMGRSASGESPVGPYVYKFWMLIDETMSAMLFVLIGMKMLVITWRLDYFAAGFFAMNIVLLGRWISVVIPVKMMPKGLEFERGAIAILTWGGLRSGLPIVLTLSMPDFHGKELILTMTYVVVVCSVLYQGLTLNPLVKMSLKR